MDNQGLREALRLFPKESHNDIAEALATLARYKFFAFMSDGARFGVVAQITDSMSDQQIATLTRSSIAVQQAYALLQSEAETLILSDSDDNQET